MYNKINFEIAKVCTNDEYRLALSSVYFDKNKTVATDGYILAEVSSVKGFDNEAPLVNEKEQVELTKPILLPAKIALEASKAIPTKANLPVLKNAWFNEVNDNQATIVSTDLTKVNQTTGQIAQAKFPDYEKIFPTTEAKATVRVNASYLKTLCELAEKLDKDNVGLIDIEVREPLQPVVITAKNPTTDQTLRCLIMPVKFQ